MTHRVKNTLTIVQAIAHQTQRYSASRDDFVTRFDGRLSALADSHALPVESDWRGADLATLALRQLEPYVSDNSARIKVAGEPIALPADIATPFGLVLHGSRPMPRSMARCRAKAAWSRSLGAPARGTITRC